VPIKKLGLLYFFIRKQIKFIGLPPCNLEQNEKKLLILSGNSPKQDSFVLWTSSFKLDVMLFLTISENVMKNILLGESPRQFFGQMNFLFFKRNGIYNIPFFKLIYHPPSDYVAFFVDLK
jgi:hypothetical protein